MQNIYSLNTESKDIFILDSFINPIDDLENILFLHSRMNNLKWKSIVISLHHALYMLCIVCLKGSAPQEVTSQTLDENRNLYFKKGDDKWKKSRIIRYKNTGLIQLSWETIEGEPPIVKKDVKKRKENLIGFWTALARVQDPELYMGRYIYSEPIILSDEEKENIVTLVNYRNDFTHFIPTSMLMHIENVKSVCSSIVGIIDRLSENFHFTMFADEILVKRSKKLISDMKRIFK